LYLSFGFWGQFSEAKSSSYFSLSRRNSRILNHLLYATRAEGCAVLKRRGHKRFTILAVLFPPVTNAASHYPAHIPADTDCTRQVAVTQNIVRDLSADNLKHDAPNSEYYSTVPHKHGGNAKLSRLNM
jgi:hypothetical protein